MATDVEIAQEFTPKAITIITDQLDINRDDVQPYGKDIAKIDLNALKKPNDKKGRLILVSATTPTPSGEGKTTTTIGLGQAFTQLNESVCLALREPSLGPCLGMKGGATGGGYSQIMPVIKLTYTLLVISMPLRVLITYFLLQLITIYIKVMIFTLTQDKLYGAELWI